MKYRQKSTFSTTWGEHHVLLSVYITLNCHNKDTLGINNCFRYTDAHCYLRIVTEMFILPEVNCINIKPPLVCVANSDHMVTGLCTRIPLDLRSRGILAHNPADSVIWICPTDQKWLYQIISFWYTKQPWLCEIACCLQSLCPLIEC